ncbi:uncharacterized protein LOC116350053 [Contarinia nasturtii]|uniref:uncharacterized protein LOC116350053 n=1 Tax=Contarinia nasturtii TaxID=265458 RepID=UPI0012D4C3C2|nr:uncharacterized protein LOC116350053 [Contarinia nasturtii]
MKTSANIAITTESNDIETMNTNSTSLNEERVNALLATRDQDNLLATARVKVKSKIGEKMDARTVVDNGSQSAMITERLVQVLALKPEIVYVKIDMVGEKNLQSFKRVKLEISSRWENGYAFTTYALVMKNITRLNVFKGDLLQYPHLQNLKYADPSIDSNDKIDLLLGVADYSRIVETGVIRASDEEPIAQNSRLGWLIMGPQANLDVTDLNLTDKMNPIKKVKVDVMLTNVEVVNKMTKFMDDENCDDSDDSEEEMTEEEKFCEEFYKKTTRQNADGRFIVSLPFKNQKSPDLGDSRKMAMATLFQLEKRMAKNNEFKMLYKESINEAIKLGHMVLIKDAPMDGHYIPHHAVMKDSTTTKLRPVHNGSAKTSNGKSLNEQMAIGKIEQTSIFELMLRWRKNKIAVIADLEKMYKQIQIDKTQYKYQLVLWRENPNEPIKTYALTTVIFGLSGSPYLAMRTLKQLAMQVAKKYPLASRAIMENFYMDNFSGGAESVADASKLCNELTKTFEALNSIFVNLQVIRKNLWRRFQSKSER